MDDFLHLRAAWESFYVIVGPAGAGLIGLQFVVIALVGGSRRRPSAAAIDAFATPTVVHLAGALLVSAVMSAPWPSLASARAAVAACSLGGLGYGGLVIRRARRQTTYQPVGEDWLWHAILPCGLYAALLVAALLLRATPTAALFAVGGAALGLLLVGIHNAWDAVTYHVVSDPGERAPTAD